MNSTDRPVQKIMALWALTEAGLGGVFHAFRIPFTGMIIAGLSVLYITLIGQLSPNNRRQMLHATILVLIIKMLISPHTPPAAYVAVLFQGIAGFVIYKTLGISRITILLFTTISLLESGFQKLFTLTLFYGFSLWDSIDAFYHYISGQFPLFDQFNGTYILLGIYFGIYLIGSIVFTGLTSNILSGINRIDPELIEAFTLYENEQADLAGSFKKKKLIGRRTWLIILLFMIISILLVLNPEMGWQQAIYVFLRSFVVIILWYAVLAPFVKQLFERFLTKQKKKYSLELAELIDLFPELRSIVFFSKNRIGKIRNLNQLKQYVHTFIFLTLHTDLPNHEQNSDPNGPDSKRKDHSPSKLD